jgi:hypothetical protein
VLRGYLIAALADMAIQVHMSVYAITNHRSQLDASGQLTLANHQYQGPHRRRGRHRRARHRLRRHRLSQPGPGSPARTVNIFDTGQALPGPSVSVVCGVSFFIGTLPTSACAYPSLEHNSTAGLGIVAAQLRLRALRARQAGRDHRQHGRVERRLTGTSPERAG